MFRWGAIALTTFAVLTSTCRLASACAIALQDVHLLLGESDDGTVWARLHMQRRDPKSEQGRRLRWEVTGRVELIPSDGGSPREVRGLGPIRWSLTEPQPANVIVPLASRLEVLLGKITLRGFRRPSEVTILDCEGAKTCGRWRLAAGPGTLALVQAGAGRAIPVELPAAFVKAAAVQDGEASAGSTQEMREALAIAGISEYQLATRVVRVFNLAAGDYYSTYGVENAPDHTDPKPGKPLRCGHGPCPAIHFTMHHGAHLEIADLRGDP